MPQPCGQIKEQKLKSAKISQLQGSEAAVSEKRIYVAIAARSSHTNHGFGDIEGFSETMDKSLAERITLLVREGITSVSDVKKCLHMHVHDVLFSTGEIPDSSCRAFIPTAKDISNHIQAALRRDRFSTVNQTYAVNQIKIIQSEQPESSVVCRPYSASKNAGCSMYDDMEENVASECEETLLFCFQSKFMKNMLLKYGTAVVCLDSTHNTSDDALPLFLVVKTPVGYATAVMLIVQFETACCIGEALNVFKQWC
ncbi:uncharacterized protein LOC144103912 [Amblyomma americanum]